MNYETINQPVANTEAARGENIDTSGGDACVRNSMLTVVASMMSGMIEKIPDEGSNLEIYEDGPFPPWAPNAMSKAFRPTRRSPAVSLKSCA